MGKGEFRIHGTQGFLNTRLGPDQYLTAGFQQFGGFLDLTGQFIDAHRRIIDIAKNLFQPIHSLSVTQILLAHSFNLEIRIEMPICRFYHMYSAIALPWITAGCLALVSCLEVPQAPADGRPSPSFQIALLHDSDTSYTLLAKPGSSVRLHARVTPAQTADDLQFQWFHDSLSAGNGQTTDLYQIDSAFTGIWNMELRVSDQEGNQEQIAFQLRVGNPPDFPALHLFQPAPGETLWVAAQENVHFRWYTQDVQITDGLNHLWELRLQNSDSSKARLYTGTSTELDYGNWQPGDYQYRIVVSDPMGLTDTSAWIAFHIRERPLP